MDPPQNYISTESQTIATGFAQYEILFQTVQGNANDVILTMTDSITDSSSYQRAGQTAGFYAGSAGISSITITPSAGTVSGTWVLYQLN